MAIEDLPNIVLPFTEEQIDAGAEALRQLEQGGRLLRAWEHLPYIVQRKWREKSLTVLHAAFPQVS